MGPGERDARRTILKFEDSDADAYSDPARLSLGATPPWRPPGTPP